MNTSDILSIIAIGISVISIIWNMLNYFRYDKPLKKMELETKKNEVSILRQEQENRKKALIKGEFMFQGDGKYHHLVVTNIGMCDARNVKIELPERMFYLPSPIDDIPKLAAGERYTARAYPESNCPQIVDITFIWDDDFATHRLTVESISIPNHY